MCTDTCIEEVLCNSNYNLGEGNEIVIFDILIGIIFNYYTFRYISRIYTSFKIKNFAIHAYILYREILPETKLCLIEKKFLRIEER